MSASHPWRALYDAGQPHGLTRQHENLLSAFRATVSATPDAPAVHYLDSTLSFREIDSRSDALAGWLVARGFAAGDRLAIMMQNNPHFVITMLATWKAGGIVVPINPMNRERETTLIFEDCKPAALVMQDEPYRDVICGLSPQACHLPSIILVSSGEDRVSAPVAPAADLLDAYAEGFPRPHRTIPDGDPTGLIVYTSGTTGLPKGALITHRAAIHNAQVFRDWVGLDSTMPVLGVAPLFHITGLVGHVALGLLAGAPLILTDRFDAAIVLDAIIARRPVFTVCAITALIALMNHPRADSDALSSLRLILSGGAPVPPAVVDQFREKFGHSIRTAYGLTEIASPTHITPMSRETPSSDGVLSIGVPVPEIGCWIAGDDGHRLPPGEAGEIVVSGPPISPGYWMKPEATAEAMRPDGFRTGDIGFMDEAGWFYIVDRKKDMIISSGYKVWPREVEDVLYSHPSVREAAVVPVADPYRGETVKAVISLKPGAQASSEEVIEFCKARMAAYKYPRVVEILDDLPKTLSGKILRRELKG